MKRWKSWDFGLNRIGTNNDLYASVYDIRVLFIPLSYTTSLAHHGMCETIRTFSPKSVVVG